MRDLIGATLGHYRIVEQIGAGGMGVVYRAHDERLDRDVAVKVLPEEVAADSDRVRRFEREAKAVAALSHPNILEIFDFDTEGHVTFAVTELLDGETLRGRLRKAGGPLPWRQVQEIGTAVANGLGAAHGKGVVHRDIKPSNIFLCADGRVKVLDFGLAATHEAVESEAETGSLEAPLTRKGSVMGTVGYMSPEQVRGEQADHRTDIFALGCVLYEMLTGRQAFRRDTTAEIMTAILREEPRSLSELGAEVAPEVENAVRRCLDKNPDRRFQSAVDLGFALDQSSGPVLTTVAHPPRRSRWGRWPLIGGALLVGSAVAVTTVLTRKQQLPETIDLDPRKVVIAAFENRTGDPSLDTLGVLVSEAIAEGASGIGDFTVVSAPTSIGTPPGIDVSKSEGRSVRELAGAAGAGIVVSGAYYLLDRDLRFQTRMTDATTETVLYEAPAVIGSRDSPNDVIDSVRQRALGAVAWFFALERFGLTTPPLLDAFLEYRRGRELFMQDLEAEVRHVRRAVEIDPNFYSAWSTLVVIHANRRLCERAGQILDEMEPYLNRFTPRERAGFRSMRAALEGKVDVSLQVAKQIAVLTKGSNKYGVGLGEMKLNRPRAAVEVLTQIPYPTDPDPAPVSEWGYWWLTRAHHILGDYAEELRVADRTLSHFPSSVMTTLRKGCALAALGRVGEIGALHDEVTLLQWDAEDKIRVFVEIAAELRAHDSHETSRAMADHALGYFDSQSAVVRRELRFSRADALILGERWAEAKVAADALLLDPWRDPEGRIVEEEGRALGGFWWGDWGRIVSLGRVGSLAARLGEREEALQIDDRLEHYDSTCKAGNRTYQRACIASQLGDQDEAIRLLKEAIAQGYWGFWGMHADIHLEPLWDDPRFLELIRPKG